MEKSKLTRADAEYMFLLLEVAGFKEMGLSQKVQDFYRLEIKAPPNRKLEGTEQGWSYSNRDYTVIVWPTWLEKEGKFRDTGTDVGWVIAVPSGSDELVYCARPILRSSSNFVLKLCRYAWVTKHKIDHIPLCRECRAKMFIFRKKGTRQYMFICRNCDRHENNVPVFESWDYALKDKAKEFLAIRRKATQKYNKKNEKEGKNPVPKAFTRKRWEIDRPENLQPKRG